MTSWDGAFFGYTGTSWSRAGALPEYRSLAWGPASGNADRSRSAPRPCSTAPERE